MKALFVLIIILCLSSSVFANSTLDRAKVYKPMLDGIILSYWPTMPSPHIIYGEVEQESSWMPNATLHTSRELGRGLGQITIAYDSSGKERFNNFKTATALTPLKKWDWKKDPYNEKFQLTYLVLQLKSNYNIVNRYMKTPDESIKSTLVCYNAGEGRWLSRRRNAKLMRNDPTLWTNGLDRSYGKGEMAILYGRPLYKAVNEYPVIIYSKSEKYKTLVGK